MKGLEIKKLLKNFNRLTEEHKIEILKKAENLFSLQEIGHDKKNQKTAKK